MNIKIWEVLASKPFLAAIIAQVSSQIIKVFLPVFNKKPPDIRKIADYGGFPSAHTAFIVAVTAAIGLNDGWNTPLFALSAVLAGIFVYDNMKMRRVIEINLNLTRQLMSELHQPIRDKIPQFKGHSIAEVISGVIWGAAWAVIVSLF